MVHLRYVHVWVCVCALCKVAPAIPQVLLRVILWCITRITAYKSSHLSDMRYLLSDIGKYFISVKLGVDWHVGWLRLVGSLKCVSFAKEPYKRDYILQKKPIILRSLLSIAATYGWIRAYQLSPIKSEHTHPYAPTALLYKAVRAGGSLISQISWMLFHSKLRYIMNIYICVYIYVYVCIYVYVYIYIFTYVYIYIHGTAQHKDASQRDTIYIYLYAYINICKRNIYIHVYMYICIYVYMYVHIYKYI